MSTVVVQKYKRVLYSTSTVHEEYKDMLYSGSTDCSTGSSTVVVQGSKLFCAGTVAQGYCGTIEACPPCSPRTEDDESCEVLDHFSAAASFIRGLSSADEGALHVSWTTLYSTCRAEVVHN